MNLLRDCAAIEYEKIRKCVISHLPKSGDAPMRLASSREMAHEFGVTQTTVVRALKDLVADGYLTVKPGIGMFTNPARLGVPGPLKLFGLFYGDGKPVFARRAYWTLGAAFSNALMKRSMSFQIQNGFLSGGDPEKELSRMGLDGLLWLFPDEKSVPLLQSLKRKGLSVLSIGAAVPGVSSAFFDFEHDNLQAAKRIFAEGRRRIFLIAPSGAAREAAQRGLERAHAEAGIAFDRSFVAENSSETQRDFVKAMSELKPDAVIFNVSVECYWKSFKERQDLLSSCLLCTGEWSVFDDMGYSGLTTTPDLDEVSKQAAANLAEQLENPGQAPLFEGAIKTKSIESRGAGR